MEQIYEWNPDIILITTFTETMPDDLYNNTIEGQDWSNVAAVQNGQVLQGAARGSPLGPALWRRAINGQMDGANPASASGLTYDMVGEIKAYYQEFYDYTLTQEQAEGILQANPEAAKGASFGGSSR